MKVMKIATVPAPSVELGCTIKDAIPLLIRQHGCAVAVMEGNRIVGTLSREDVVARAIGSGLNPERTKVSEIMNSPAATVSMETETDEALKWMFANRKCHLGIVDQDGILKGWLAICSLFEDHVEDLTRELDSLAAYISADGPGG